MAPKSGFDWKSWLITACCSSGVCLCVISVILIWPQIVRAEMTTGLGQVWVHIGAGRLAIFLRDESGAFALNGNWGRSCSEVNIPSGYFWPRTTLVECPGLVYVSGNYYTSQYSGCAVALDWYSFTTMGMVFWVGGMRARRELKQSGQYISIPERSTGVRRGTTQNVIRLIDFPLRGVRPPDDKQT